MKIGHSYNSNDTRTTFSDVPFVDTKQVNDGWVTFYHLKTGNR